MNLQAYISSGVIEAYVLGLASAEEVQEVETYAVQYTEVKNAITNFEIRLEKQALENALPPPAFLKEKVLLALEKQDNHTTNNAATPTGIAAPQPAKVVSLVPAPKSVRWLRGAVAASVILLLGSAILNFYYYSQYKKFNKQYADLLASQSTLITKNEAYRANFIMVNDTAVVKVKMQAAAADKLGATATVFWNKQSDEVYLTINNLPAPVKGKQYQLWAIVNGQPVNAGMVKNEVIGNTSTTSKMIKISNAQAFAITLENAGGSPTPHLEQLYVLGKV